MKKNIRGGTKFKLNLEKFITFYTNKFIKTMNMYNYIIDEDDFFDTICVLMSDNDRIIGINNISENITSINDLFIKINDFLESINYNNIYIKSELILLLEEIIIEDELRKEFNEINKNIWNSEEFNINNNIENDIFTFVFNIILLNKYLISENKQLLEDHKDEKYNNIKNKIYKIYKIDIVLYKKIFEICNVIIKRIDINEQIYKVILKIKADKFASFWLSLKYNENSNYKSYIDNEQILKNVTKQVEIIKLIKNNEFKKYDSSLYNMYDEENIKKYEENIKKYEEKIYQNLALLLKTYNKKINYYNYGSEIIILNYFRNIFKEKDFINCDNFKAYIDEFKNGVNEEESYKIKYSIENYFEKIIIDIYIYCFLLKNNKLIIDKLFIDTIFKIFDEYLKKELNILKKSQIKLLIEKTYSDIYTDSENIYLIKDIESSPDYSEYLNQIKYNFYKYKEIIYNKENCENVTKLFNNNENVVIYFINDIIRIKIKLFRNIKSLEKSKNELIKSSKKKVKSLDNKITIKTINKSDIIKDKKKLDILVPKFYETAKNIQYKAIEKSKKLEKELIEQGLIEKKIIDTTILDIILEDKIYRLVYYIRSKYSNYSLKLIEFKINAEKIMKIINIYLKEIIKKLKITENSKNKNILIEEINYYNKENNINYYNYGSEAWIFYKINRLDIENIRKEKIIDEKNIDEDIENEVLQDIIYFVDEIKNKNKKEDVKIKYNLENYLNKIGYDIAIYLYIYTNIISKIEEKDLLKIVENHIENAEVEINDRFINKMEQYYIKIITNNEYKNDIIKNMFSNSLYRRYSEQLKYNLYLYKYKNYEKEQINLWFINNCKLQFQI